MKNKKLEENNYNNITTIFTLNLADCSFIFDVDL
jgi:hypothetical protein